MGLIAKQLGIKAFSIEDPSSPLLPQSAMFESLGLGRSDAGVLVNEKQAMRLATVYACVKVISEDLASLPLSVYQRLPNGAVREATEHRLYPILHDEPNAISTSMIFREALISCALIYGNGYALINRDRAARAVSLTLLPPGRTNPVAVGDKLYFVTTATENGEPQTIPSENVLHVPALSFDGVTGISPIRNCMQAVGLAIAAEKFGAQFFGNGARATGVFSHPGTLDAEAYENLKKSVREWATGDSALRPIILEEGLKWDQVTIPPNEAQFLETRKFQRSDIAAIFRVPLHMIQDLERSTNNNIEHQSIEYVRHTLRPLATRIEQEINRKLLSGPFYAEHDLNELMRGDFVSQTEGFQTLRNCGVYSSNDIRRRLRENPIPSTEGGDVYLAPLNMVSLASMAQQSEEAPAPVDGDPGDDPAASVRRGRITNAFRPLFRDAVGRSVNRGGDATFTARALQPLLKSMAEALLAIELPGAKFSAEHEKALAEVGASLAEQAPKWNTQNASDTATELAADAYSRLADLLAIERN